MEIALVVLALLVLATWWVSRVNARYERRAQDAAQADARIEAAWDDAGLDDDATRARTGLERLLREAPVASVASKRALVQLAVMAVRAEHFAPLREIASRARVVAAGCGETLALEGLAEAYAGDPDRARRLLARAGATLGGCASCGGDVDGKVLLQEVAIALDALGDESDDPSEAGEARGAEEAGEARRAGGAGSVRIVGVARVAREPSDAGDAGEERAAPSLTSTPIRVRERGA